MHLTSDIASHIHTQLHFVISLWWCPGRERNVALFSYWVKSLQYVQPTCYVMLVSLQWFGCIGIGQDINLTYMLHAIFFDYMEVRPSFRHICLLTDNNVIMISIIVGVSTLLISDQYK